MPRLTAAGGIALVALVLAGLSSVVQAADSTTPDTTETGEIYDGLFNVFVISNPGTPCADVGEGERCAFVPDDDNENVKFGYCGPDLFCASNGAHCRSDDECFQFCGSDEKCGGLGAECSSRSTNHFDVNTFTCNTPETICSKDEYGGVCVLNPSARPRAGGEKRKRSHDAAWMQEMENKYKRAAKAVALPGDEELDL